MYSKHTHPHPPTPGLRGLNCFCELANCGGFKHGSSWINLNDKRTESSGLSVRGQRTGRTFDYKSHLHHTPAQYCTLPHRGLHLMLVFIFGSCADRLFFFTFGTRETLKVFFQQLSHKVVGFRRDSVANADVSDPQVTSLNLLFFNRKNNRSILTRGRQMTQVVD